MEDLEAWATEFGLTHAVGDDDDRLVLDLYTERAGRPQYAVVDRGFDVVEVGLTRDEAFALVLEELEVDAGM